MSFKTNTTLESLPIQLIQLLCSYLPPVSSVSLMLSCRRFMIELHSDILLWRRILEKLDITFKDEDIQYNIDGPLMFPPPFRRFIQQRSSLINNRNRAMQRSSRLYYNLGFEPQGEREEKNNVQMEHSESEVNPEKIADLVTHSTIAYDFDESNFVLIQSKDRSGFWQSYRPQSAKSNAPTYSRVCLYSIIQGECQFVGSSDLPFEVAGQDMKVYRGMLFLLPITVDNTGHHSTDILLIYRLSQDQEDPLKLLSSFSLEPTIDSPERYRLPPHVYKESGEKRIYILDQKREQYNKDIYILVLLPCPVWTILIFKMSNSNLFLSLVKEVQIKEASSVAIGQIFTADQKTTTTALALYTSGINTKRHKSLIVTVSTPPPSRTLPLKCEEYEPQASPCPNVEIVRADESANFLKQSFNLLGRVQDMKLYYISATNYYHTSENVYLVHSGKRKAGKDHCYYAPVLVLLLASDRLVVYSSHNQGGQYINISSMPGIGNHCLPKNWHHSELQVLDKVPFKRDNLSLSN